MTLLMLSRVTCVCIYFVESAWRYSILKKNGGRGFQLFLGFTNNDETEVKLSTESINQNSDWFYGVSDASNTPLLRKDYGQAGK